MSTTATATPKAPETSPGELAVRAVLGRIEALVPQMRIASTARAIESASSSIVNLGAELAGLVGEENAKGLPNAWPILRDLLNATRQYATPDPSAIRQDAEGLLAPVVSVALGLSDEQVTAVREAVAELNVLERQTPAERLHGVDRANGKVTAHVEQIKLPAGSVVVVISPLGESAKSSSGWGTIRGHAKLGRSAMTPAIFDPIEAAVAGQQVNMTAGRAYPVTGLADGWTVIVTVPDGFAYVAEKGWQPVGQPTEAAQK